MVSMCKHCLPCSNLRLSRILLGFIKRTQHYLQIDLLTRVFSSPVWYGWLRGDGQPGAAGSRRSPLGGHHLRLSSPEEHSTGQHFLQYIAPILLVRTISPVAGRGISPARWSTVRWRSLTSGKALCCTKSCSLCEVGPQVLTNGTGDPMRSTMTLIMFLNKHLFSKNYGMGGALSVFLFIITGVLSLIVFRFNKIKD